MKTLIAGVGNIFFADDGFGCEVARALAEQPIPEAKVVDFGIRGMHLAYELLAGYDRAIIVDALPRGGEPGTVYVVEPDSEETGAIPDAHGMDLQNVFAFVRRLGGTPPPITLVGCEPGTLESAIGLSMPVASAVPVAAGAVRRLMNGRVA